MNKLIEMEVFVQVVNAGSLAAAARRLHRNPSSVSKFISALEERLGVRLLTRTTRHLTLTDAGQDFYVHCKAILIDIDQAEEAATATSRHRKPSGCLRITGMDACSPNIILPLISGFLSRYPGIQVDLNQAEFCPDMTANDMDVALSIGEIKSKLLTCVKLAPSRQLICASPEYLASHGTPQSIANFKDHNCIRSSTSCEQNNWEIIQDQQTDTVQPSGSLAANNAQLVRQAALSGWGICQLSDFIIGPDIEEGRLVVLFPEQLEVIGNYICAIYPRKERPPNKTLVFVEYLKEQLSMTTAS